MQKNKNNRVGLLDEIRGFAIICMVIYHIMFDLKFIFGVDIPIFFEDWFDIVQSVFAGAFIFISGAVCRYSRSNVKRGAMCFFLGMVVTFVTAFVSPQNAVLFGILHFLGISMMIFGLGENVWDILPPVIGIIVSALLFLLTMNIASGIIGFGLAFKDEAIGLTAELPPLLYNAKLLFPLGFAASDFHSGDYFPLLPWIFVFFAGAYFGVYVKEKRCPAFVYKTRIRFLAAAGRHTLWIYLLHQPVVYGIMWLIFK